MKIKNIKIEIKSFEVFKQEIFDHVKKCDKKEKVKPLVSRGFHSIEDFRNFFTPKRIEILKMIKKQKPQSVYKLSKLLNRDIKSVNVDLKILSSFGIVELKKNKRSVVPFHDIDKIKFELAL